MPADSLTFTQQVQQHSLPRSRSRQALALTGMLSGQVLPELKPNQISAASGLDQTSNLHQDLVRSEGIGASSQNPSSPDRDLKRNGILTNPKYGSPTYSRFKAGDYVPPPNSNSTSRSYSRTADPGGSSGYSSSQAGTEGELYYRTNVDSAENTKNIVQFAVKTGRPEPSPQIIGTSMSSPKNSPTSLTPSKKTAEPVYSPNKPPNPMSPPSRCEDPVYSAKKPVDFVYSPKRTADEASSPTRTTKDPQFYGTRDQTGSPSPLNSPVISMTTMDPQLHLKQAIKLQFEGRTCGFNFRKETPL